MAEDPWSECLRVLRRIESLTIQESGLIDAEEFDEIWSIRRTRDRLSMSLSLFLGQEQEDVGKPTNSVREIITLVISTIHEMDHKNMERLEGCKEELRSQLYRLHSGRIAVCGYGFEKDSIPSYLDRTS